MKFYEVIKQLVPAKHENPLSRLYGYQRDATGKIQIVEPEAKTISTVVQELALHQSESLEEILDDILQQFSDEGIRNRSGKRWTRQTLLSLVRPIYAGVVVSPHGIWRKSRLYQPIVSVESVKMAMKRLKTEKLEEMTIQ